MAARLRTNASPADRASIMHTRLGDIIEAAEGEALACSRVLAKLDLRRARECQQLARRSRVLKDRVTDWLDPEHAPDQRLADALEYQEVVMEAVRLGL